MTKTRASHKLEAKNEETRALGARFRATRQANGVTLDTVAKEVGKTIWCIRRHEAGEMMLRLDELCVAARCMRVRPTSLVEV
jgi:transcriptional regulator with XRE-family HTH domain